MIGTLDSQVIEKFKEFQNKTGKYLDLDIEKVEFEKKLLKELHQQKKVKTKKNSTADKFIEIGDIDRKTKKYDISNKVKSNLPEKGKHAPRGTILVSRVRPLLGGYTIIDGDDYTFTSGDLNPIILPENVDVNYVFKIICSPKFELFLKNNQNTSGQKPTITDKLYNFDIAIPLKQDKYKSYDIQKAIVEFLEYSFDNLEQIKNNIDKRYDIVSKMKKSLIPSTFKKTAIKNKFKKYAQENNIDFEITDIKFNELDYTFDSFFDFNGGSSAYTKPYYTNSNNKGDYPLLTGSTNIVEYIKPINDNDVTQAPAISYNKDNDKGSVAFYHTQPFIAGGHHYVLKIKDEFLRDIDLKYTYYLLNEHFSKNMYFQSKEPRANSGTIKEVRFLKPQPLNKYSSLDLQQILANFIEHVDYELEEKHLQNINQCYIVIYKYKQAYLKSTFSLINWS